MAYNANSMKCAASKKGEGETDAPVFLLIGSCALDRLLTVSSFPVADSKIRTTSYDEVGGGNAANTASAIGILVNAQFFCSSPRRQRMRVKLLSKVGDDAIGQHIIDELNASNVETSSQLFRRGDSGSTTSFTTVIVDKKEQTRTCIHTPGTCGELSLTNIESLSQEDIDQLFQNVIHLHSDSRQTAVSLWMAKEAKKRGITVSCDCEKDRKTTALDELIEVSDILFTNSNYLGNYLHRLTCEREAATGRRSLSKPEITIDKEKWQPITSVSIELQQQQKREQQFIETCIDSLTPSIYFARWQQQSAIGKEVVVTHGAMGALHYKQIESSKNKKTSSGIGDSELKNTIDIEFESTNKIYIRHSFDDDVDISDVLYEVHKVGVLKDATVVDTTGAGDAFIGGFIVMSNIDFEEKKSEAIGSKIQICLETGSYVGGHKLGGTGARTALPTGRDFDLLGSNVADVKARLQSLLSSFNNL